MLQVYTGAGKGKTTAAIGLLVRAVGAGMRVYMMQFMKGLAYSEQDVLRGFAPQVVLSTTGKPFFVAKEGMLTEEERAAWGDGVVVFEPGKPGLAILDEVNVALFFGLLERARVERLLDESPKETELVLTGRNAPDWLMERADLVTEMREVKHYYQKGIEARKGIEN